MIDELEVDGLDVCSDDQDIDDYNFYTNNEFQYELMNIFEMLDLSMSKSVISIIQEFCKPGITFIHTRDGGEFAISIKALRLSKLLSIEAELRPSDPIHLTKCSGRIISHISKYLIHHNGVEPAKIPKPIRSSKLRKSVDDPWDVEFANNLSKKEIFRILLIANYIDCQSLLHLMCAKIATLTRGRSPEEVKRILEQDDAEENEQNQPVERSICMCGYVWQVDKDTPTKDSTNDGEFGLSE